MSKVINFIKRWAGEVTIMAGILMIIQGNTENGLWVTGIGVTLFLLLDGKPE